MKTAKKRLQVNSGGIIGLVENNGVNHLAAKRPSPKPKKIYDQKVIQRSRLRIMVRFLGPLAGFMNLLYKKGRSRSSGINKVFNGNVVDAVVGEHPKFKIDYSKVLLSKGVLPNPPSMTVSSPEAGRLVFCWEDNSGIDKALAGDNLFIAVYDKESKNWITELYAAYRKDCRCELDVLAFRGKPVHTYAGFVSDDLARTSGSLYTGMVNIA